MMFKIIAIFCLLAACQCRPEDPQDLESALEDIFGPKSEGTSSAPVSSDNGSETPLIPEYTRKCGDDGKEERCVPYYLCKNPEPSTGIETGITDIRYKSETCEQYIDICCSAKEIIPESTLDKKKKE